MAKNKKNNRNGEFLLQTAEAVSVLKKALFDTDYPAELINKHWKCLLLNQFHDIIPGSSIKEVYDESDLQYALLRKEIGDVIEDGLNRLADNVQKGGILVYNPNSFTASGYISFEDELVYAEDIPSLGYKVIEKATASQAVFVEDYAVETPYYTVLFDENMNISSLYDKENCREVVAENESVNRLSVFEDYPRTYDNWEITDYYKQKKWNINNVRSVEKLCGNGWGGFKLVREYCNSVITQEIIFYANSRRIDVKNEIDWEEDHQLLKVFFPLNVHANKATYEIQFGNVERPNHQNTSWDRAKFEVCAHKWCDLSDGDFGVSIINDCKYGHSALENELSLTLIKCGTYPNPEADRGYHSFTYSLYPHSGDFRQGGTIKEAYLLNSPMRALSAKGGGSLYDSFSYLVCDCENIIVETVKKAEDSDDIIIRLYDSWNVRKTVQLNFAESFSDIYLCDMMENRLERLGDGNKLELSVKNFEIVTLCLHKA